MVRDPMILRNQTDSEREPKTLPGPYVSGGMTSKRGSLISKEEQVLRHLIRCAQRGCTSARDELLREFYPVVRILVRSDLGPELRPLVDRDDLIQGVVAAVNKSLGTFCYTSKPALIHWIRTIATSEIRGQIKYHRAKRRNRSRHRPLLANEEPTGPSVLVELLEQEQDEELLKAVDRLPPRQKEVYRRVQLEGATVSGAAAELHLANTSARRALASARANLAAHFGLDDPTSAKGARS